MVWFAGQCGTTILELSQPVETRLRSAPALASMEAAFRGEGLAALQRVGSFVILLDGRVDNAPELARALELPPDAKAAELIAAAYRRWRDDFPAHVLGDYVFALWNEAERTLVLGRDATGILPLFLCEAAGRLHFASEMRLILASSGIRMVADEEEVATRLRIGFDGTRRTMFEGVQKLEKGELLVWRDGQSRRHRFWHPERLPMLRLRDPREYAEAALEVLYRAVARRLPAGVAIATHLSGGLDSSTVTDTAARLLAHQGRGLTAYTAVPVGEFDASLFRGRFCDETELARSVAGQHGNVEHVLVSNQATTIFAEMDALCETLAKPVHNPANLVWMQAIVHDARRRGIGLLLDGVMSNFTFSYAGELALPTLLRAGRLAAAVKLGRGLHRHQASWKHIVSIGVLPLLPPVVRLRIRQAFGRQPEEALGAAMGANATFLAKHGYTSGDPLREQTDPRVRKLSIISGLQDDQYALMARAAGLASASPTADREVIEFCLCVPEEQFCTGGDRRALMRNMMAGLLPQTVLRERRKGLQAADSFSLVTRDREEIARELGCLEQVSLARRVLDLPRLKSLVERWPVRVLSAAEHADYTNMLPRAICMGRFLRRLEEGKLYSGSLET